MIHHPISENTELGDLFISIFAAQLVDSWFGRGLNQDDT